MCIRDRSYSITIVCIIIFICSSFLINQVCGFLSIPLIVLLLGYSLTKRFTFLSHFVLGLCLGCLLYTSPSPRDRTRSRMPSSA